MSDDVSGIVLQASRSPNLAQNERDIQPAARPLREQDQSNPERQATPTACACEFAPSLR
jgi:hypothetical protein